MSRKQLEKIAKKFGGWIEGGANEFVARFPSPYLAKRFEESLRG